MRNPSQRKLIAAGGVVTFVLILAAAAIGITLGHHGRTTNATTGPFEAITRPIPSSIDNVTLQDENGQSTSLHALQDRIVVLADSMTSCQEECPITTGALESTYRALSANHLLDRVTVLEVSVDSQRDTPARLRAYKKYTGVHFLLATGTSKNLAKLWKWFGVSYWKVKEDSPPDVNWQNKQPYAYDIDHSDDVFVLDTQGNERYLADGMANVGGTLPARLASLLGPDGKTNLKKPGFGNWSPANLLGAIGNVADTRIPNVTN